MRTNTTGSTCDESYAIDDGHAERKDARSLKKKQMEEEEEEGLHSETFLHSLLFFNPKSAGFLILFSIIFPSGRTDFAIIFLFFRVFSATGHPEDPLRFLEMK